MSRQPKPIIERFKEKVQEDKETGCWNWTGAKTPRGYPKIGVGTRQSPRTIYAHRFSFEVYFGKEAENLEVHHKCRNPSCVNPEHLELVSRKENLSKSPFKTKCFDQEDREKMLKLRRNGFKWCDIDAKFGAAIGSCRNHMKRNRLA